MERITIYRITVYTGSETEGTLHVIHKKCIALRDTKNLEAVARSIMTTHSGDEVTCYEIATAQVMD